MRIIFAGTTNFSARYLNALIHSQHKIIAVLTQKHSTNNYEKFIYENDIQNIVQRYRLPTFQPKSLKTNDIIKTIKYFNPDIIIVVSYGLIIPKTILHIPPLGCINVHGSLLPRWRGAAPIQRAIEAGDTKTGITIIQMDTGIDTGSILHRSICDISLNDTSLSIFNKLANIGIKALLKTLTQLSIGQYTAIPQIDSLSTYAKKINKLEGKINWDLPAIKLERQIRAFNPWPKSYFQKNGKKITIWEAKVCNKNNKTKNIIPGTILSTNKSGITISTHQGSLTLLRVQEEGKKIITVHELLNSKKHWFTPGSNLKKTEHNNTIL